MSCSVTGKHILSLPRGSTHDTTKYELQRRIERNLWSCEMNTRNLLVADGNESYQ
jgi:hypothetical protein